MVGAVAATVALAVVTVVASLSSVEDTALVVWLVGASGNCDAFVIVPWCCCCCYCRRRCFVAVAVAVPVPAAVALTVSHNSFLCCSAAVKKLLCSILNELYW